MQRLITVWLLLFASSYAWASPVVMVFGDSLSANYGIEIEQGWVSLLQQRLRAQGLDYQVVNASISGDTTQSGLNRLSTALQQHQPKIVILELGGNDGLRGLPLLVPRRNLVEMIDLSHKAGAQVLLAEMRIPPNYGARYTEKFQSMYSEIADDHDVTLIPFMLEGIAGHKELMQADGIHPTAEAQEKILNNVWPTLAEILD